MGFIMQRMNPCSGNGCTNRGYTITSKDNYLLEVGGAIFVYAGDGNIPVGFYAKEECCVNGSIGKNGERERITVISDVNVYKAAPFDVQLQSMSVLNPDGCSLYPFNKITIIREESTLPGPINGVESESRSISKVIAYVNDKCAHKGYIMNNYGLTGDISIIYDQDDQISISNGNTVLDISNDMNVRQYLNVILSVNFGDDCINVTGNSECGNYSLHMPLLLKTHCDEVLATQSVPDQSSRFVFNDQSFRF